MEELDTSNTQFLNGKFIFNSNPPNLIEEGEKDMNKIAQSNPVDNSSKKQMQNMGKRML